MFKKSERVKYQHLLPLPVTAIAHSGALKEFNKYRPSQRRPLFIKGGVRVHSNVGGIENMLKFSYIGVDAIILTCRKQRSNVLDLN